MTILPKEGYHLPSDRWLTHWKTNWWILKRKVKRMTWKDWVLEIGRTFMMVLACCWSFMLMIFMTMSLPELLTWVEEFLALDILSGPGIALVRWIPMWWTLTGMLLCMIVPMWIAGMMLKKKKPKADKAKEGGDSNIH